MKKYLLASAILLSLALSANAEEARPAINPEHQPTQMFKAEVFESDDAILFSIPEKKVQYFIAKPNHPAYPYMIENLVLGRGKDTRFKAMGYGEAGNEAATTWLKEIDAQNAAKISKIKMLD